MTSFSIDDPKDISFEHIVTVKLYDDILEFHHGLYFEYRVIVIKSNDYRNGFINATNLCLDNNKLLYNWLRIKKTKETLKEYKMFIDKNICFKFRAHKNYDLLSGIYFNQDIIYNLISSLFFKTFINPISYPVSPDPEYILEIL